MKQANEPHKSMFISYVRPLMGELLNYPFGNIVSYKLQNSFPQLNKNIRNSNCGISTFQVNKSVNNDNNNNNNNKTLNKTINLNTF
jgi:hypothetical protein